MKQHPSLLKAGENIAIYSSISDDRFAEYKEPVKLESAALLFVTRGEADVMVNLSDYRVKENDMVTLTTGSIIRQQGHSDDFDACLVVFDTEFIKDLNLIQSVIPVWEYAKANPVLSFKEDEAALVSDYLSCFRRIFGRTDLSLKSEIVKSMLKTALYGMASVYGRHITLMQESKDSRKNDIYRQFQLVVLEHYANNRDLAFYADKLCITAKHLSAVIKEVSGKAALDIITGMVIMDAQSQLHTTYKSVSEISDSLNFPNPSFFGRYFKQFTGLTPKQYRDGGDTTDEY